MSFDQPLWLTVLLLPALLALAAGQRPRGGIPLPALAGLLSQGRPDASEARVTWLRCGALAALVLALAGPSVPGGPATDPGHSLDIMLALDISGSMAA
ncbi:MAG: BatA domain-containing protein, partial [Cyanobacteria bacterium REEB65]|nr:BatA domain-containing protein [Cyanobacteria bacterium REEB65]